jgi:hypothetical protein
MNCIKLGTWDAPVPAVLVVAVTCSRMHHPRVPLCAGCYDVLLGFGAFSEEPKHWWCAVCFQGDVALRAQGVDVPFDVPDLLAVSEPVAI